AGAPGLAVREYRVVVPSCVAICTTSPQLAADAPAAGAAAARTARKRARINIYRSRKALELVRRGDERRASAGLERDMAGVRDDLEPRLGPGAVQVPGVADRADEIVAAVDDDARYVADARHLLEQVVIGREEGVVLEVVAFDAGERDRLGRILAVADMRG